MRIRLDVRRILQPVPLVAGLWLIGLIVLATAPQVWPGDGFSMRLAERLAPPSVQHPFGTDEYGRDLLARVLLGGRYSLGTAAAAVFGAALIGVAVGALAAWWGGWPDYVIMRVVELFMSFPVMVLAIAIVAAMGAGLGNAAIAIFVIWWGQYARLTRGEVLRVKGLMFVEGARAIGGRDNRLLLRHVLPNSVAPVVVKATIDVGVAILLIGGLSFIGLGAQPPTPEWGLLVSTGRKYLLSFWWYPVLPGAVMFVTVIAINLLADHVIALLDPRFRTTSTKGRSSRPGSREES